MTPQTLHYQHLPRPDSITFEESEAGLVIRVPPPPRKNYLRAVRGVIIVMLLLCVFIFLGVWNVYRHPAQWPNSAPTIVPIIGLIFLAWFGPGYLRSLRCWYAIVASPTRFVLTGYERTVWAESEWPREEIADVRVVQLPRQANLSRPAFIEIRFTNNSSLNILGERSLADLERIATAVRERLAIISAEGAS